MDTRPVGEWLDELASAAPAPGGGAAAALAAAVGASLVCMVCNLTIGKPKYAASQQRVSAALARAEEVRRSALRLADDDARAFEAVIAAYGMPRSTDAEKETRSSAIQKALAGAAEVPLRTAGLAATTIGLAREILDGSNANVISDVGVAAASARAALESSVVNVEVNLAALTDAAVRSEIAAELHRYVGALEEADVLVLEVRERIAK